MFFVWLITLTLSFVTGVLFIKFLTAHPLEIGRYSALTAILLYLTLNTVIQNRSGYVLVFNIPLLFIGFLVGYSLMARRVLGREDHRYVPMITREPGDLGKGHTAVVYFTHGEPETYDPIGWINQFREFDEHGIKFVPFLIRPYFLYILRKKYLQVGKSNHRQMHHLMLDSLERTFREQGDLETKFYISFLDDEPRPDAAVIQALNDGASKIIVCEVFLTISNHTAEGKKLIDDIKVEENYKVPVIFTGPFWDSKTLKSMFVQRVNAYLNGREKADVGVLLVGHGQPDEWDKEWLTETSQETSFREDILKLLEDDGFRPENLSQAWMEFKEPKPASTIEEFVGNGVKRVLYFSAAISADAIHSQYDVPELVHRANVPTDIEFRNLGAWNNDPIVIQAIREKIDQLL
jgi:protoheme ferro-lyase